MRKVLQERDKRRGAPARRRLKVEPPAPHIPSTKYDYHPVIVKKGRENIHVHPRRMRNLGASNAAQ